MLRIIPGHKDYCTVHAVNSAEIDARVVSAAFALAIGVYAGVGASIGVAIARNDIGFKSDENYAATYTTASNPTQIVNGNKGVHCMLEKRYLQR